MNLETQLPAINGFILDTNDRMPIGNGIAISPWTLWESSPKGLKVNQVVDFRFMGKTLTGRITNVMRHYSYQIETPDGKWYLGIYQQDIIDVLG